MIADSYGNTNTSSSCLDLDAVLCTEELDQAPSKEPQYKLEAEMLSDLAVHLAEQPESILQALTDLIVERLGFQSAGVSLLTPDQRAFYWPAVSGIWEPNRHGGTPRDFGPCGDVIDRKTHLLFKQPARRYKYINEMDPPIYWCLLVPFYHYDEPVGTIWVLIHDEETQFDKEDLRLLKSLSKFASAVYAHQRTQEIAMHAEIELSRLKSELKILSENTGEDLESRLESVAVDLLKSDEELRSVSFLLTQQIQEPAKIVSSYLKLLAVRYKDRLGPDADEFIDKCLAGCASITRMLDDLWHYTRATTPAEMTFINSATSLNEALTELDEMIKATEAVIRRPDTMPNVFSNNERLTYVWKAVIENAIKYRRSGTKPSIEISIRDDDDDWLFIVNDEGVGIDIMDTKTIFKPFTRLNSRPDSTGSGMSLATVRRILEAHGGSISADTSTRTGAEFVIRLPRVD